MDMPLLGRFVDVNEGRSRLEPKGLEGEGAEGVGREECVAVPWPVWYCWDGEGGGMFRFPNEVVIIVAGDWSWRPARMK